LQVHQARQFKKECLTIAGGYCHLYQLGLFLEKPAINPKAFTVGLKTFAGISKRQKVLSIFFPYRFNANDFFSNWTLRIEIKKVQK